MNSSAHRYVAGLLTAAVLLGAGALPPVAAIVLASITSPASADVPALANETATVQVDTVDRPAPRAAAGAVDRD